MQGLKTAESLSVEVFFLSSALFKSDLTNIGYCSVKWCLLVVLVQLLQTKASHYLVLLYRPPELISNFNCVNRLPWDTQHVHKHHHIRARVVGF